MTTLGASAYFVKAQMPRTICDSDLMASEDLKIRQVLADNLTALAKAHGKWAMRGLVPSQTGIGKKAGVDQKTVARILTKKQGATVDMLSALADAFRVEVWHLLVPGLDPSNLPVYMDEKQRRLIDKIKQSFEEFSS